MTPEQFCRAYPRLFHMAEAAAWPGIRRHGLLSTSALLDLYGVTGEERERIEHQRRPAAVPITHAEHGQMFINDQRPMTDATLGPALIDMTPSEWYAHLNARVFFWVGEARLGRLLNTYRERDKIVIVLDSAKVLARYAAQTMLSPINSGFSLRYAQRRGRATFLPLADYPFEDWVRKRGVADAVAECTVLGGVANVEEALVEIREVRNAEGGTRNGRGRKAENGAIGKGSGLRQSKRPGSSTARRPEAQELTAARLGVFLTLQTDADFSPPHSAFRIPPYGSPMAPGKTRGRQPQKRSGRR